MQKKMEHEIRTGVSRGAEGLGVWVLLRVVGVRACTVLLHKLQTCS